MLGDKNVLSINYNNENFEVSFNYKNIKNLYELVNDNPFTYINNFIEEKNEDKRNEYFINILYCLADTKLTLQEIEEIVKDTLVKTKLEFAISSVISVELNAEENEDNKKKDKKDASIKGDKLVDKNKEFNKWWNDCYFVAIYQLKLTLAEFLLSTPREILTLNKLHFNYQKNILIDSATTVLNAMYGNDKSEEKKKIVDLRDVFK